MVQGFASWFVRSIVRNLASTPGRFGSERPLRSDSHKTHEFLTRSNVFRNTDGKAALHELSGHHSVDFFRVQEIKMDFRQVFDTDRRASSIFIKQSTRRISIVNLNVLTCSEVRYRTARSYGGREHLRRIMICVRDS